MVDSRIRHAAGSGRLRAGRLGPILAGLFLVGVLPCRAQFGPGFGGGIRRGFSRGYGPIVYTEGGVPVNEDTVRTAREIQEHSSGTPDWKNPVGFEKDTFTFARIIFNNTNGQGGVGANGWLNDFPDSDLNLSYRLHELTTFEVDPDGRTLRLTDPTLTDYPFIYMVKPGYIDLSAQEITALHNYLLNGGVLMADDFWGDALWSHFEAEMKLVLPGRTWKELSLSDPIFHSVFDLKGPMSQIQVPSIRLYERQTRTARVGDNPMQVRAWYDDQGRIMVLAVHNSDNGDGWEREGEDSGYFNTYSEPRAYPFMINLLFYLMTH